MVSAGWRIGQAAVAAYLIRNNKANALMGLAVSLKCVKRMSYFHLVALFLINSQIMRPDIVMD